VVTADKDKAVTADMVLTANMVIAVNTVITDHSMTLDNVCFYSRGRDWQRDCRESREETLHGNGGCVSLQSCHGGPGGIVHAGMDDARVMAGLMMGNLRLLRTKPQHEFGVHVREGWEGGSGIA